jgi:CRP-like cAMP-binding protein
MVGAYATLAGSPIGRSAVAAEAGRALRIDRDELFDLFAQHPRLLQQMFSGLFPSRPLSGKAAAADKTVVELTPSAVSPL